VEVNITEGIADTTPAAVDVNEKPDEGGPDKTTGGGEAAVTPNAKAAPAKTATKAATKMEGSLCGEDNNDEEEKPAAKADQGGQDPGQPVGGQDPGLQEGGRDPDR
jgi:hypothetical protein